MISIDRMELADIGGNPVLLARALLSQLPDISLPIPVREIAKAVDIFEIREEKGISFEGALVTSAEKLEASVVVREDRSEERKRFTIGHELGHYLNPWHVSDNPMGFRCSSKQLATDSFNTGDRLNQMEVEANEFSAELLMPTDRMRAFLNRRRGADIGHIVDMANTFSVSKEAAARRYIMAQSGDPAAVIFSVDNIIRYVRKNEYFPNLAVWNSDHLPLRSLSRDCRAPIGEVSECREVEPELWLSNGKNYTVFEQTMRQANGFQITLLSYEKNRDGEDERLEKQWKPKFAYRR